VRARELGLKQLAWIHELSAIGCWARAGNLFTAERLGRVMLADPDLTDRLRQHVQSFLETIRARRKAWASERESADATPVPA
jgi:hypothetical protein